MSITAPLYNATAQRFNAKYDHALKAKLRQTPEGKMQPSENWHIKQRELLFADTTPKSCRTHALCCISNLAGYNSLREHESRKGVNLKFVGIAATDVNDKQFAHGFAAFRQGVASIINTGQHPIYAGEYVYWQVPDADVRVVRGTPKDKRLARVVGENGAGKLEKMYQCIGQALCGAEPGQPFDVVMSTTTCCEVPSSRDEDKDEHYDDM